MLVAHTLTAADPNAAPKGGKRQDGSRQDRIPIVAQAITAREGKGPDSDATSGFVPAHTLRADGFDASEDGTGRGTPIVASPVVSSYAKTVDIGDGSGTDGRVVVFADPRRHDDRHRGTTHDKPCLNATNNDLVYALGSHAGATIPRRLTPRECERLQGFPDDWTRYADDGRAIADGPRYRMLGNAVTVNVAEWIGRRLPV